MGTFKDILDSPANTPFTTTTSYDTGIRRRVVQPRDGLGKRPLQLLDSIREDGKIRDVRISSNPHPQDDHNDQISRSDLQGKVDMLITRASGYDSLGSRSFQVFGPLALIALSAVFARSTGSFPVALGE